MSHSIEEQRKAVKVIKRALTEVFGEFVDSEDIDRSVYPASEDPGEWAPNGLAVISLERGLPVPDVSIKVFEDWFEVTRAANRMGLEGFVEQINGAVSAFYA